MLKEKKLIWRLNRGDKEVLWEIYQAYKHSLVTLAASLLYDKSQAEDAVQDVFVGFIKLASKFRLTGSLKGYLSTCVANNARNRNKAARSQQKSDMAPSPGIMSYLNGPEERAMLGDEMTHLKQILSRLPDEQREALMLHLYSGLTFRAVAKHQDVSINTALSRYHYGLNKLRSLMNSEVKVCDQQTK